LPDSYLAHLNIDLATITGQAAFAWWTLVPLVIGYIAAAMAQFMMLHGWPLQPPRWIVGTAIVAALAVIGHDAGAVGSLDAGTQVGGEPVRRDIRDEHCVDRRLHPELTLLAASEAAARRSALLLVAPNLPE
jgi:hypothetical protein